MGLSEDVISREGIVASMEDVALKQFLFLRNLAEPVIARFGDRGTRALGDAFKRYGQWRGENIRMSQASLVSGHDALAFLANWDSCDFVQGVGRNYRRALIKTCQGGEALRHCFKSGSNWHAPPKLGV